MSFLADLVEPVKLSCEGGGRRSPAAATEPDDELVTMLSTPGAGRLLEELGPSASAIALSWAGFQIIVRRRDRRADLRVPIAVGSSGGG